MRMISFFRIIKTAFQNFRRNIWLSAASTLVMMITLIILSVLTLLFVITNYSVSTIRERVDISAYFKTGLAESQITSVRNELAKDARIKEITYITAEQALQNFKDKHLEDQLILDSINELSENPLPATLQIKAANLEDYPAIAQELNSDKYRAQIDKVNFEDNRIIINRLNTLLRFIITFGLALVIVFGIIAILVIFNTITLTIYNRREEVEIMRLVGATNWYIRGPFIVEAMIYSLAATIITSILLLPVYIRLLPKISAYLNPDIAIFTGSPTNFATIVLVQLVIAFALSAISSLWAIRRYLRI
jgi:cell division transport system permease protein